MKRSALSACALMFCLVGAARGWDLPSSAVENGTEFVPATTLDFPRGAFQDQNTQVLTAVGNLRMTAYALPGSALTSFQMIEPLQTQWEEAGFDILFACADSVCGGYDFRFLLEVLPEPDMHVDLGDFQYVLAQHEDGRILMALTSRTTSTGFIQISQVSPAAATQTDTIQVTPPEPGTDTAQGARGLSERLTSSGHVVLDDLQFDSGATSLGQGPFASLQALASFLLQNPDITVTLVGHTDAVGSLAANTSLSRKRATAVRQRLISIYAVPNRQISADGIGYLSPIASNLTEEGREKNRRVEAVITSTQ